MKTDYETCSAEYVKKGGRLLLFRLFGEERNAVLPRQAEGMPLYGLADHVFAPEPSVLYGAGEIDRSAGFQEGLSPVCGEQLQLLTLPEGLEEIGSYAFYGCDSLREISFPSSVRRIGSGLFSGCQHLSRLIFHVPERGAGMASCPTPPVLQEILKAVTYEVEVIVKDTREHILYRLLYPGYFEESKENTPARIIEIIWHGTGYQYRNTFLSRRIQFHRYDELLPAAEAQEEAGTLVRMALCRLAFPESLLPEHGQAYAAFLREHAADLWKEMTGSSRAGAETLLLPEDMPDSVTLLRLLDRWNVIDSSNIDQFILLASGSHTPDAAAFLMDLKHERYAPKASVRDRFAL